MFLALALTSALALAPQAAADETCREAYVEAWFQETAEADLEAALRSYARCIALGDQSDRELVARALWRMGMIARAREEMIVAEELFARVLAQYDGTRAASRAREALAAPIAPGSTESEAVAEARGFLTEMLYDPETATQARFESVLRNLGAAQIVAECEQRAGSVKSLLTVYGQRVRDRHTERIAQLVFLADAEAVGAAIDTLANSTGAPDHPPILKLAHGPSARQDYPLFNYLNRRTSPEAMSALRAVVDRSPELLDRRTSELKGSDWNRAFGTLFANPHPFAGELFDRLAATRLATPTGTTAFCYQLKLAASYLRTSGPVLLCATAAGERVRAIFSDLPVAWRDELARQVLGQSPSREVIDLLLADADPAVRRTGSLALLHGADPTWRTEMIERVKREPIDVQLDVLGAASQKSDPALPTELLLRVEPGVAREFVYSTTLSLGQTTYAAQQRGIPDVLRLGLDRGDPELLRAVFAASPELSRLRRINSPLHGITQALQQDLPVAQGQGLAERLTLAALAAPEEAVRLRAPEFARGLLPAEVLTRCMEPALRSSSAALRRAALSARPQGIANETLVRLLLDPNHLIFQTTLSQTEPGPAALLAVLDALSDERQRQVLDSAKRWGLIRVVRSIYNRATSPQARENAREVFEYLKTRDADTLIAALSHRDRSIQVSAATQLVALDLPEWDAFLWLQPGDLSARSQTAESQRILNQRNLRARRAEVAEALQRWNVETLTTALTRGDQRTEVLAALAGELAALDDRKRLIEYALRGGEWTSVGGRGLVLIEDRDALRSALRASYDPAQLLTWALELDLVDTLFGLERAGRLDTWDLIRNLMSTNRHADLARLLLGEDGPYLDRALDGRTVSLIVDAAAGLDDPVLLSRAAARLDSPAAVKALFERGELELVLTDLPSWRPQARHAAMTEIARRTGEAPVEWPEYVTEQEALIASWRKKLGE